MKKYVISLLAFSFWLFVSPAWVFAQSATLSLDPSTGTFNQGCGFSLGIKLDTGGVQTDGTDVILLYDSSRLVANSIAIGSIYPDFPGNNIDSQNGKITISGLASVNTPFSGSGILATVNFTVKSDAPAGATQVNFDFDPNNKAKTTDSNVVERGTVLDVLNTVVNGNYIIGTGVCGSTPKVTPTPRPFGGPGSTASPSATTAPPRGGVSKSLPDGGTPELTSMIAIIGTVLTVLGVLGLAFL